MAIYPPGDQRTVWIAIGAALFILAITLGTYGYMDEQARRNGEAVKQQISSPT